MNFSKENEYNMHDISVISFYDDIVEKFINSEKSEISDNSNPFPGFKPDDNDNKRCNFIL
jgi:hypothetical protein